MARSERQFFFTRTMQADILMGPGGPFEVEHDDVQQLVRSGLLRRTGGSGSSMQLLVTIEGFEFIETIAAEQTGRIEEEMIQRYIDGDDFRRHHPVAYQRWAEAAALLWSSEAETELTTIGHKTREAVQEFASSLMQQHAVVGGPTDPAKTVARLQAVIARHRERLGVARSHLLDALVVYWGEVNDLLQRQEHGGQKEGDPLTWEDGRRAVFHTAIVMYEIDRTL